MMTKISYYFWLWSSFSFPANPFKNSVVVFDKDLLAFFLAYRQHLAHVAYFLSLSPLSNKVNIYDTDAPRRPPAPKAQC